MEQEHAADESDNDEFLDELLLQVRDGALDEAGAVVSGDDLDTRRQAGLELLDPGLDRVDRLERILAGAHDDHPARHFALTVQLRDAASHFGSDLYARDVSETHRNAAIGRRQRNLSKVVERLQVPRSAHHVFRFAQLEHRAARLLVRPLHGIHDFAVSDVVAPQLVRIEHDLVLPHHAADARDFRNVGHGLELVLEEPVLERTQLRQVHLAALVDERVLVYPAHAGRIGPERGLGLQRQPRLHLVQVLEHARTRPVLIGAVLEQDVDE